MLVIWFSPQSKLCVWPFLCDIDYFDGLVQDCGISSALTMDILQFCTKLPLCVHYVQ